MADMSYPAVGAIWHNKTSRVAFLTRAKLCDTLEVEPGDLLVCVGKEKEG